MRGDSRIEIYESLVCGIEKIKDPSEVIWKSVAVALVTSVFFWAGPVAIAGATFNGLPTILAVCGGSETLYLSLLAHREPYVHLDCYLQPK